MKRWLFWPLCFRVVCDEAIDNLNRCSIKFLCGIPLKVGVNFHSADLSSAVFLSGSKSTLPGCGWLTYWVMRLKNEISYTFAERWLERIWEWWFHRSMTNPNHSIIGPKHLQIQWAFYEFLTASSMGRREEQKAAHHAIVWLEMASVDPWCSWPFFLKSLWQFPSALYVSIITMVQMAAETFC